MTETNKPAESEKSVTLPPGPKYQHPDKCERLGDDDEWGISMFMQETPEGTFVDFIGKPPFDAPMWFSIEGDMAGQFGKTAAAARKRLAERMEAAIPMTDNEADSPTKPDKAHGKEVTFLDLLAEKRRLEIKLSMERTANGSLRQRLDEARATIDRLNEQADSTTPMTDKEIIENLEVEKNYLHRQVGELRQQLKAESAVTEIKLSMERTANGSLRQRLDEAQAICLNYEKTIDCRFQDIAELERQLAKANATIERLTAERSNMESLAKERGWLSPPEARQLRKTIAFALTPKESSPKEAANKLFALIHRDDEETRALLAVVHKALESGNV